jgi:hypothetical protein
MDLVKSQILGEWRGRFLGMKNLFRKLKFLFRGTKKPGPCLSVVDICPPTKTTPYTLEPWPGMSTGGGRPRHEDTVK